VTFIGIAGDTITQRACDELAASLAPSGFLLDNVGLVVRAPAQPEPNVAVLVRFERMYGRSPRARAAAYRAAVAVERRRLGRTRDGDALKYRRRMLAAVESAHHEPA
jgi:hypothetical protein